MDAFGIVRSVRIQNGFSPRAFRRGEVVYDLILKLVATWSRRDGTLCFTDQVRISDLVSMLRGY